MNKSPAVVTESRNFSRFDIDRNGKDLHESLDRSLQIATTATDSRTYPLAIVSSLSKQFTDDSAGIAMSDPLAS